MITRPAATPTVGRPRLRRWLGLLVPIVVLGASPPAHCRERLQAELKAVWLYKFAHFVEWPPGAFEDQASPLRICVLADPDFADLVASAIEGEQVGSRALKLVRLASLSELSGEDRLEPPGCHILFLGESAGASEPRALEPIQNKPVLSVSEAEVSASDAATISLLPGAAGRIELRVDRARARCAGLSISAKLLRISTVTDSRMPCAPPED